MPIHPLVYEVALRQLRAGATLTAIQTRNRHMCEVHSYPGQLEDVEKCRFRWLLKSTDTRSLYRQYHRLEGVNVMEAAHINVDDWLTQKSPRYNSILANAVFEYSPRTVTGDRFEISIATPEMKEAAWKYGHASQILLDGTFGVCNQKLLLFIVMALDEERRGVPLAFLMFSAPSGNQFTAGGYNKEIIARLLTGWKNSMGLRNGEAFRPAVAITDTDVKERGALADVFPGIWLLICKFHLRQAWKNHLNHVMKGTSPLHQTLRGRLKRLAQSLVESTVIETACGLILAERSTLETIREKTKFATVVGQAMAHLDYLSSYWMREAFWRSWSDFGRQTAARILQCPLDGVLRTTNHLESFNGVLKRKYLRGWQNGNRRLRLDILVRILIMQVLPSIFRQRALEKREFERMGKRLISVAGGDKLLRQSNTRPSARPLLYLVPDEARDADAAKLLKKKQISAPELVEEVLKFTCYSSLAIQLEESSVEYKIVIALDGFGALHLSRLSKPWWSL